MHSKDTSYTHGGKILVCCNTITYDYNFRMLDEPIVFNKGSHAQVTALLVECSTEKAVSGVP